MARVTVEILTSAGVKVAQMGDRECACITKRTINGEWNVQVSYTVPPAGQAEDKSVYFVQGSIVRVRNFEDSTYRDFVITNPAAQRNDNGVISFVVVGDHASIVEWNRVLIKATLGIVNVTPTTVLAKFLSYAAAYNTLGTIEPAMRLSIPDVGWETVQSGINKLLKLSGGELEIESDGKVSIYSQLGDDNGVRVVYGKNMNSLRNTKFYSRIANKVYGVGGGQPAATIAGARHTVASAVGSTITADSAKLCPENDAWNGFKLKFQTGTQAGVSFTINDCTHGATQDSFVLASAPSGVVAGDKFTITESDGTPVKYLLSPASVALYGTIEGCCKDTGFTDAVNLVAYPAMDGTYSAGLCQGWTKVGTPTVSEETNAAYLQYGTKSQKVIGATALDGISQVVPVVSGRYYFCSAWVYVQTGSVTFQVTDGVSTWKVVKSAGTGWQQFSIVEKMAASTITVKLESANATFWIDAVQVTEGVLNRSFTNNSSMTELWNKTFDQIMKTKDPQVEYSVDFVDLYKMYPVDYPMDKISLGDTVSVYDSALGISGLKARLTSVAADEFFPEKTKYTISNIIGV